MKIWLAIISRSCLGAPCQDAWDEIAFLGNILEVTLLSDKDSSAQAPGLQGGLFASSAHFAEVTSSPSKATAPGMGLFFHVWACLIRSQGSPAQAGKCLLVSANTDDRNVCPGHCSAVNGAEKTLQSVVSTDIPASGCLRRLWLPGKKEQLSRGGQRYKRVLSMQESGAAGPAEQPGQESNTGANSTPQRSPRLSPQEGQGLTEHFSSR